MEAPHHHHQVDADGEESTSWDAAAQGKPDSDEDRPARAPDTASEDDSDLEGLGYLSRSDGPPGSESEGDGGGG